MAKMMDILCSRGASGYSGVMVGILRPPPEHRL